VTSNSTVAQEEARRRESMPDRKQSEVSWISSRDLCSNLCDVRKWLVTSHRPVPHVWTTRPNSRARNVCELQCSTHEGVTVPIFTAVSSCRISRLVVKPQEKVINSFTIVGKNMLFSHGLYSVSYT